jgi:hypothetical protein
MPTSEFLLLLVSCHDFVELPTSISVFFFFVVAQTFDPEINNHLLNVTAVDSLLLFEIFNFHLCKWGFCTH